VDAKDGRDGRVSALRLHVETQQEHEQPADAVEIFWRCKGCSFSGSYDEVLTHESGCVFLHAARLASSQPASLRSEPRSEAPALAAARLPVPSLDSNRDSSAAVAASSAALAAAGSSAAARAAADAAAEATPAASMVQVL